MLKTIENCNNCKYGPDNHYCSVRFCGKCKMHTEGACKCVIIKWDEECEYYEPANK